MPECALKTASFNKMDFFYNFVKAIVIWIFFENSLILKYLKLGFQTTVDRSTNKTLGKLISWLKLIPEYRKRSHICKLWKISLVIGDKWLHLAFEDKIMPFLIRKHPKSQKIKFSFFSTAKGTKMVLKWLNLCPSTIFRSFASLSNTWVSHMLHFYNALSKVSATETYWEGVKSYD